MKKTLLFLSLSLSLAVVGTTALRAQSLAEITGTVSDSSGAVIAGATVTITNVGTNQSRPVQTNSSGAYTVPFLNPGLYEVKVEMQGFSTASRKNITLQVGDVAKLDFALQVGSITETVEVLGGAPLLNTENATVGTVIENRRIVELPLNGRNYLSLVALSPNVTQEQSSGSYNASRQGGERASQTISVAGTRIQFVHYTLDGVENTDVNFNTFIIRPSIDALQEFKVTTGIYPAEFGRSISHINVTTKAGTNDFHGTAFEFLRNSALDAKQWRQVGAKNPFRRNQFGFMLGGPVWIPKVYNGRDRLFFMANYEGLRDSKTLQGFANVATERMRNGDFSGQSRPIYDPLTRVFVTDANGIRRAVSATQFPGNIIPKTRFNPNSLKLLEFYPLPTVPGDNIIENYVRQIPRNLNQDQFTARIDFIQSEHSTWFGRFSWGDEFVGLTASFPNQAGNVDTSVFQGMLSNIFTFGPAVINEFRMGYNQFNNGILGPWSYTRNVGAELTINRLGSPPPPAWGGPSVSLGEGLSGFGETNSGPYVNNNHAFTWQDTMSVVRGTHSIKFGGEYRYDLFNQFGNDIIRGAFGFTNKATFDPVSARRAITGHAFASYLLGETSTAERSLGLPSVHLRAGSFALFIDDSWKITPKLTMNLGLRYENTPPYRDTARGLVNAQMFDPGVMITPDPGGFPPYQKVEILPTTKTPILTRVGSGDFYEGSVIHYGDIVPTQVNGEKILGGLGLVRPDNNNFAPRLGLAYNPTPNWSVRVGAGLFYVQDVGQAIFDMSRNLSGRAYFYSDEESPNSNLNDPWLYDTTEGGCSNWAGECAGASTQVQVLNVNQRTPYVTQWLANIQRQVTGDISIEVGYLGNAGAKLQRIRSYNEPVPRTGLNDGRTIEQRRPWKTYGRLHSLDSIVNSNYHGGSVKLQQRFSKGFTYLASFTWSKAIDNGSAIRSGAGDVLLAVNGYDFGSERALSQHNVGRRFVTSFLYELPFGAGKRFLNHRGPLDIILGGWQISSIITFSDGTPYTVTIPETNGTQWGDRPHATGMISPIPEYQRTASTRFWNIAAFDATNPDLFYRFGTAGRNSLIGPGYKGWDFSLVKDIKFADNQTLQVRFEAFNFANHPNWDAPGTNAREPATFGRVNTARTMREMQMSLKYIF